MGKHKEKEMGKWRNLKGILSHYLVVKESGEQCQGEKLEQKEEEE